LEAGLRKIRGLAGPAPCFCIDFDPDVFDFFNGSFFIRHTSFLIFIGSF